MADLPFQLQEIRQKTNINHGPLYSGHLMAAIPAIERPAELIECAQPGALR